MLFHPETKEILLSLYQDDSGQTSSNVVIASAHPHDNEIPDSVHVRTNPNAANIPSQVESEHRLAPKLNLGNLL